MIKADALVLGAGMIGVSTALHLQECGRRLPEAGEGTSYENAGLIQREGLFPYAFPRNTPKLLKYFCNALSEAHYQLSSLPTTFPWLVRYFACSTAAGITRTMRECCR